MKKITCFLLCLVTAFMLSGCSKDNFMDVYGFTNYYNRITSDGELSLEDYLCYDRTYSTVLTKETTRLHLALEESEKGKIEEIRLLIAKTDEKGNKTPVSEAQRIYFCDRLTDVLGAYTDFTSEECKEIIKEMSLHKLTTFSAEGELTMTKRDWHMVYYSNALASVFMIFNIHLHPVEKTEKPVSKPDFGNTAYTREG